VESEDRSYPVWYPAFEQKAAYQRNMSFALVAAATIAALSALLIWSLEPGDDAVRFEVAPKLIALPTQPTVGSANTQDDTYAGDKGDRLGTDGRSPDFAADIRIIPDAENTLLIQSPDDRAVLTNLSATSPHPDAPSQWPPLEGSDEFGLGAADIDFELGPDKPYLPSPKVIWSWLPGTELRRESPAIVFAALNPRYIELANDTGHLVVDLTIDKRGQARWTILQEEPKHRGFGRAYDDMLLRSKFTPGSLHGERVDTRVVVDVHICLSCEATLEVVEGDVVVSRSAETPTQ
jgi:hypothetical protein